jgi:hypothetical protein
VKVIKVLIIGAEMFNIDSQRRRISINLFINQYVDFFVTYLISTGSIPRPLERKLVESQQIDGRRKSPLLAAGCFILGAVVD